MRLSILTPLLLALPAPGAPAPAAAGADSAGPWVLAFADDFDRAEVGPEWQLLEGRAEIRSGRLVLTGVAARIVTRASFSADVRIELTASSEPSMPPCDLSVVLGSNEYLPWGYLLAFGGNNNQLNQILGHEVHAADREPERLIEPGRTYRLTAVREGRRLEYLADGKPLLWAAIGDDPLGGAGFGQVGFITWTGMVIDEVRIYERRPPHPDTPPFLGALEGLPLERDLSGRLGLVPAVRPPEVREAAALAAGIDAFNDGRPEEAAQRFRELPPGLLRAAALAFALGHLDYEERDEDRLALAGELSRLARERPEESRLGDLARAARELTRLRVIGGSKVSALRLLGAGGRRTNPFHDQAKLYLARYTYWDGREGGNQRLVERGLALMRELLALHPGHPVLREYAGEKVVWGEDLAERRPGVPAWAADLREVYMRQLRILRCWIEHRQRPDGSLGGGWGDDVEILRTWGPVAAISSAAPGVMLGIERLAEGVWRQVLQGGYAREVGDVEHSAEPSADTLPAMLLLRHGDPLWFERNLESARTVRDHLTGRDARGHVRFRSTELGSGGPLPSSPRAGGDTPYHVRAMKHHLWLAWYGDPEARAFYLDWVRGWGAATLREAHGKPSGVPPGTIWYPAGDIVPPLGGPWWDPHLNTYGWPGFQSLLCDAYTSAYGLSGDPADLEPFLRILEGWTSGPLLSRAAEEPGSPRWIQAALQELWLMERPLLQYRLLTDDRSYDGHLRRLGGPVARFHVDRDFPALAAAYARTALGLRVNFRLRTSEVIKTDRAALEGASLTFGAYTGAPRLWGDGGLPLLEASWISPDADFAAVVLHASPRRLRVRLYRFKEAPGFGLRVWRLLPGEYRLLLGRLASGEEEPLRAAWDAGRTQVVLHRGEVVPLDVPAGEELLVDLRLVRPLAAPEARADLAVAARDLEWDGSARRLAVTAHNIGADRAAGWILEVRAGGETLGRVEGPELPAPRGLQPSRRRLEIEVPLPARARTLEVVLDPAGALLEVTEANNSARLPLE